MISVVIVTYRRCHLLAKCLASIVNAKCGSEREILVVVNGEDDFDAVECLQKANVSYFVSPKQTPGEARNLAIAKSHGEWICFLDDDVEIPQDYFVKAECFYGSRDSVDVFGGPDACPPHCGYWSRALAATLTSPLATATTRFRHDDKLKDVAPVVATEEYLILCNLWIKKTIFAQEGQRFDSRFFRNEENVLLAGLVDKMIYFVPSLIVFHSRNVSWWKVSCATALSARMRLRSFVFFPSSTKWQYLVPAGFVLYLVLLSWITLLPIYLYIVATLLVSSSIGLKRARIIHIPAIVCYQVLINVSYGCGTWYELFVMFLRRILTCFEQAHLKKDFE